MLTLLREGRLDHDPAPHTKTRRWEVPHGAFVRLNSQREEIDFFGRAFRTPLAGSRPKGADTKFNARSIQAELGSAKTWTSKAQVNMTARQIWQRPTLPCLKTKYHRRRGVSRPSSEWDRVQPPRHNHQISGDVMLFARCDSPVGSRPQRAELQRAQPEGRNARK